MPEEGGRKMDEIRKYSAIYGRFDCKRKQDKPLTMHEVNICILIRDIRLNLYKCRTIFRGESCK